MSLPHSSTRQRAHLGDVLALVHGNGYSIVQYVMQHAHPPRFGSLVRLLKHVNALDSFDLNELCRQKEEFVVFYPVGVAVSRGYAQVIGAAPIPERFETWPLFKNPQQISQRTGERSRWFLWDGHEEWLEDPLAVEHYDLPCLQIVTNAQFEEWSRTHWHPRNDVFVSRPDLRQRYEQWLRDVTDNPGSSPPKGQRPA